MTITVNILGSGAIGGLCAAGAQLSATPYSLWPRPGSTVLNKVELLNGQTVSLEPLDCADETLEATDLLVVPLKVTQLKEALKTWRHKLSASTAVVLLHNGMGGMELAAKYLPDNPVFLATTSHGALKTSATSIRHTGKGETMLGSSPCHTTRAPLNTHIAEMINRCIGPVTWRDDIETALWQKLAVNCAINPLTALNNIPNGGLLAAQYAATITGVCEEVCAVARACKIELEVNTITALVYNVIERTAENFSSMHQDVIYKRTTEIEGINGYIVKQAKKKGIDVPINTLLYKAIKAL
ncbi:MAG: 2-dehydropantoate 2-reductase [Pseudomonadota bacterium]|nr:2-dehydropantoate 2-reductase [Pseudomonadota bacterium]